MHTDEKGRAYCHDETALSWAVSRGLALTGFPGHRRFTVRRLREALEAAGLAVTPDRDAAGADPDRLHRGALRGGVTRSSSSS
jgi:hypothetical protein